MFVNSAGAEKELTRADVRAIAARIYEPHPRIWSMGGWQCPQCREVNSHALRQCACGITREGYPNFANGREKHPRYNPFSVMRALSSSYTLEYASRRHAAR
jgi:hypothetical protein